MIVPFHDTKSASKASNQASPSSASGFKQGAHASKCERKGRKWLNCFFNHLHGLRFGKLLLSVGQKSLVIPWWLWFHANHLPLPCFSLPGHGLTCLKSNVRCPATRSLENHYFRWLLYLCSHWRPGPCRGSVKVRHMNCKPEPFGLTRRHHSGSNSHS
jgi:hypothetical protein